MTTTSRRQRILRGMGGGFAAGAIVGALTMALNPPFNGQDGFDDPGAIVAVAAYLGVLGSIPGGAVGAFCCNKWRDVSFATAPTQP